MRREIITTGFYNFGVQGVGIVSAIIIARVLGPEQAGRFNFGVSYSMLFQAIFVTGISSAFIGSAAQQRDEIVEFFSAYVVLLVGLNVLWCAGFLPYVCFSFWKDDWSMALLIYTLVLSESLGLAYILNKSWHNVFVEQRKSSLPSFVRICLIKIFQVVVVCNASELYFLGVSSLFGSIVGLIFLFHGYQAQTGLQWPRRATLCFLARESVTYSLININKLLGQQLDKVFLGAIVGYTAVGFYVVGQRLGSLIEIIGASAGIVFFPLFTSLIVKGKDEEVRDAIQKYLLFVILLIVPILLSLSLCSEQLVSLVFGTKYRQAGDVFKVFVLLGVLSLLTIPYINLLLGQGRQLRVVYLNLMAFIALGVLFSWLYVLDLEELLKMELVAVARLVPYGIVFVGVVVSAQQDVKSCNTTLVIAGLEILIYLVVEWLGDLGWLLWHQFVTLLAGCLATFMIFFWSKLVTNDKL